MRQFCQIDRLARSEGTWIRLVVAVLCCLCGLDGHAAAVPVAGFTEPYRSVDVATTEVGIIQTLEVSEGDRVKAGQIVAILDSELQAALVSIARKSGELRGRLEAASAELRLRKERLEKLIALQQSGHARREEVERTRADVAIAEAQLLTAEEEIQLRKLEYEKTAIQLKRRQVSVSLDGIVALIHKEEGEFVAPADPKILQVVQLEKLLATFSVPSSSAGTLAIGMPVKVNLSGETVPGIVERIAPVTDAESDTVRVKIQIDNQRGEFRSGQRCLLYVPDETGG